MKSATWLMTDVRQMAKIGIQNIFNQIKYLYISFHRRIVSNLPEKQRAGIEFPYSSFLCQLLQPQY